MTITRTAQFSTRPENLPSSSVAEKQWALGNNNPLSLSPGKRDRGRSHRWLDEQGADALRWLRESVHSAEW